LITPAPNLRFDGRLSVGQTDWPLDGWVGMRGHNWGTEHAWTYAYGNCNLWDDGAPRTVDGFTAHIRVAGMVTPGMSLLQGLSPDVAFDRPRHWFGAGTFSEEMWQLQWRDSVLRMDADRNTYVGLRYVHPDGRESFCYNTKFARVHWTHDGAEHTSQAGELEVLFPAPMEGVDLHPTPDWDSAAGDYRSV